MIVWGAALCPMTGWVRREIWNERRMGRWGLAVCMVWIWVGYAACTLLAVLCSSFMLCSGVYGWMSKVHGKTSTALSKYFGLFNLRFIKPLKDTRKAISDIFSSNRFFHIIIFLSNKFLENIWLYLNSNFPAQMIIKYIFPREMST